MTALAPKTNPWDFEALVREHERRVFSIAYHFLRNAEAAEEVAQDVFLELFRRLGALESQEHVRHWLRRVTCHRAIDYARRNKMAAAEVTWDELPEPSRPCAEGDAMLERRLRQMVAGLPPKMRLVVILRYQEDAALEEIAQALDIPLNTVKSTLHRAHAVLRERMEAIVGAARV